MYRFFCRAYQLTFRVLSNFMRIRKPQVLEGEGSLKKLSSLILKKGLDNVFVVTDKVIYSLSLLNELENSLKESGIKYTIFTDVSINPTIENVEMGLIEYTKSEAKAIIAVGGGSVMDCAKVVGARVANPKKSVLKMAGLLKVRKKLPPLFAVPTTAGTGSEATLAGVVTDSKTHRKFAINDPKLVPLYAVLDPTLTVKLPSSITAMTGLDALTHAVESFIGKSNTNATKEYAKKAFILIKKSLLNAFENGEDILARTDMLNASFYAGLAFTRAYVGNVHAIAHTLSGFYSTPHGLANAILLPHVLEYYSSSVHKKLAQIADITGLCDDGNTLQERARAFIDYVKMLNEKMGIPKTLDYIKDEDMPFMIRNALKEANPLYPVPKIFDAEDFRRILEKIKSKNV